MQQDATDSTPAPVSGRRPQGGDVADAPAIRLDASARWAVLGALLLTLFLSALDQTVVGTALPRIVTDLNGTSLYSWVVTSYLLTATVTVPVYGKLADAYGAKPTLIAGVVIFLVGSALSGLSQNMAELVIFRGIQGLGAGAIFPIVMAVIGAMFTVRERGRYQGLFGAVFGLSFIVGPFLGGYLTDHLSWHWVFYVNLPVGVVALAVLATVLQPPPVKHASMRELDYLGIATFTAGVVPLLLGLTNKGEVDSAGNLYTWTDPHVGGLIAIGVVLLAVFLFVETRAREPIIPLDLFREREYAASMGAVFFLGMAMFTAVIFLPRFYQTVRGISATESGYYIWPMLVGIIGSSIASGQLIARAGRYKWIMVGSTVVLAVGAWLLTHLTVTSGDWPIWGSMLVMGLGVGPSMAGFTVVIQAAVPVTRLGVASSTMTFLRQIGGSVGLAVANTVFIAAFTNRLPGALASNGVPQAVVDGLTPHAALFQGVGNLTSVLNHLLPPAVQPIVPKIVAGINEAFTGAIASLFWITIATTLVGMLFTLALRNRSLRSLAAEYGGAAHPEARVEPV